MWEKRKCILAAALHPPATLMTTPHKSDVPTHRKNQHKYIRVTDKTALRFQTDIAGQQGHWRMSLKQLPKTKPLGQYTTRFFRLNYLAMWWQTLLNPWADGRGGGGLGGGQSLHSTFIMIQPKNTSTSRYHKMVLTLIRQGYYFICKRLYLNHQLPP